MANDVLLVPKLNDAAKKKMVADLLSHMPSLSGNFAINITPRLNLPLSHETLDELDSTTNVIQGFDLSAEGFNVSFRQGVSGENWNQRKPSQYYDEIQLSFPEKQKSDVAAVIDFKKATLQSIPSFATPAGTVPSETEKFAQAQYSRVQEVLADLVTRFDERERNLDERKEQLEADHGEKLAAVEKKRLELNAEIEKERKALEVLRKELDDRDHMHVRRQLREKITDRIRARLTEPPISNLNRQQSAWIALICIAGAALLFVLSVIAQLELATKATSDSFFWALTAKSVISGAGAVGFILYAISWLRKTYTENVGSDRALERYSLDIDRASWSIETLLEMSKTEGATIPSEWVSGVCKGLFEGDNKEGQTSGLQALGALMDVAGGAEVGPDGTKISLNRRGTKALAKQAED